MEVTQVAVRIQLRRDTAANWSSVNPILRDGEMGIESDTLKIKAGNGTSTWSQRPYLNVTPAELAELAQDSVNSAIIAGTGLDKSYDDQANTITLDIDSTVATKDYVDTAVGTLGNSVSEGYVPLSLLDQADGVATLDADGYVPLTELNPTVVITTSDQTLTNKTLTSPIINNPTGITKSDVGLGNVDNTSDANKPVSTAQATAISTAKSEAITAATEAILGVDVPAALNTLDELAAALNDDANYAATITTALGTKAPLNSPTFTGIVNGITKAMVGLGSVDNTADTAKPISTATQTALDAKLASATAATTYAPLESPTFTGTVILPANTISQIHLSDDSVGTNEIGGLAVTTEKIADSAVTSAKIANNTIIDADINSDAAIAQSKISGLTMDLAAKAPLASPTFIGTVSLPIGTVTSEMILNGTIVNDDISNSAAIALSKLATDPLARENHTGQQIAQTISDFNEAAQDAVGNVVGHGLTYSDASGAISVDLALIQSRILNVTDTEMGYLDGVTSPVQTQLNDKAPIDSPTFTGTVSGVTKSHVGLDNVNNTSDANKPISTATQSALDLKANLAGPSFSGTTNAVDLTLSGNLTLSGAPTSDLQAATKAYVDAATSGLNVHASVKAATTANINLNNQVESGDTLDGVTLAHNDRILVKNQNTESQNGIYIVEPSGAPTRADDYNAVGEVDAGDFIFVESGTVNGKTGWIQTNAITTLGTDPIAFTQFSGAGTYSANNGLTLTGNVFSINTGITADLNTAQTLTNKTISGGSNTLSNIANSSLTNSSITIGSSPVSLGSTLSTIAGLTSVTSTTFVGSLTGNASTVTNGVYTTGSYSNPTWLSLDSTAVGLGNVENTAISTFPGSTAIVSLGTVTAGTWSADTILPTKGGTGLQSYATGDIIYSSAPNTLSRLAAGSNGQILTLTSGVPSWQAAPITLPTQTSNSGKYLTTDGTTASWATVDALPTQTSNSGKYLTTDGTTATWAAIPASYTAPTIGGVSITSGGTFSSFSNLTLTGDITVPEPTTNSHAVTKLYTDTKAAAERTYTNERLEIVPLDDVSTNFNGSNTRFLPKVAGQTITISNPLRLLVNINGIIQMLGNQDNHWLSPIVPDGFYIDSEGYMQFGEPVPTGSTFDARLMSGKTSNTLEKSRYPFRATDILLGA